MSGLGFSAIALLAALLLASVGVPIGFAMGVTGLIGMWIVAGPVFAGITLQTLPYSSAGQYAFVVVPMFVLMGTITAESGATQNLFQFAERLLRGVRGSLLHATTLASAGFAAISGSTVVNAALFTRIALPEMVRLGYDRAFASGCIAASGTLAALIPPSLSFVIYGILTGEPIGALLIAGIIPGILTLLAYMLVIALRLKVRPQTAPHLIVAQGWRERIEGIGSLWPIMTLAALVIGGIYVGFMTPSSAGAVGASGALAIAILQRRFSVEKLKRSLQNTVVITSALFMIVIGGLIFSRFLLVSGAITESVALISDSGVTGMHFLLGVVVVFFILGMFMDPMSMLVMTIPLLYPISKQFGFDGIWLGVIVVKLVEIAVITPPVGMNLFAVVSASNGELKTEQLYAGIWSFVVAELLVLALLVAFPLDFAYAPADDDGIGSSSQDGNQVKQFDIEGSRVLVFGGSSGIGFSVAKLAADLGAEVSIASRSQERQDKAARRMPGEIRTHVVDVTDPESVARMFEAGGSYDHVVVSAAQLETAPLRQASLADSRAAMDSKFWGAVHVAREARFSPEGTLTLVSGILNRRPSGNATLLGAINAALDVLGQGLALELAPVRVNIVSPGRIDTEWWDHLPADARRRLLEGTAAAQPVKRVGLPDDVAKQVLAFWTNDFMTGSVVAVDGGISIA